MYGDLQVNAMLRFLTLVCFLLELLILMLAIFTGKVSLVGYCIGWGALAIQSATSLIKE